MTRKIIIQLRRLYNRLPKVVCDLIMWKLKIINNKYQLNTQKCTFFMTNYDFKLRQHFFYRKLSENSSLWWIFTNTKLKNENWARSLVVLIKYQNRR